MEKSKNRSVSSSLATIAQPPTLERALRDEIQLVLLLIQPAVSGPEAYATERSQDGDSHVIPDKQRIRRQGDEGFPNSVRDGAHEKENCCDD